MEDSKKFSIFLVVFISCFSAIIFLFGIYAFLLISIDFICFYLLIIPIQNFFRERAKKHKEKRIEKLKAELDKLQKG